MFLLKQHNHLSLTFSLHESWDIHTMECYEAFKCKGTTVYLCGSIWKNSVGQYKMENNMHMVLPFWLKRLSRIRIMYICIAWKIHMKLIVFLASRRFQHWTKTGGKKSLKIFYIVPVLWLLELMQCITPPKVMYVSFKCIFMFKWAQVIN